MIYFATKSQKRQSPPKLKWLILVFWWILEIWSIGGIFYFFTLAPQE